MTSTEIHVEGMSCEGCEKTASGALLRLEGVEEAVADHRSDQIRVSFDPDRLGEPELRAALEDAGYQPV